MEVTGAYRYPIKSCAGTDVSAFDIDARGPVGDRRWMLVNERGRFLTAREHPTLVTIRPVQRPGGLELSGPSLPPLSVSEPDLDADAVPVTVWKDSTTAADAGDEAAAWFSGFLGQAVRLVFQRDNDRRDISGKTGAVAGDEVSFADGYPLLLIGTASLADLNARLARPVTMTHFRPNLVVRTEEPFIEDTWTSVTVGDLTFAAAKRCARCVLTTVDPDSGEKDPAGEPLKTLRAFRFDRPARGIMFGMNLIPRKTGRIAVGAPVIGIS